MLILVRHGRTQANADGLLQGRSDLPLDEVGRAQAAAVAAVVCGAARIICSPLRRALETASYLDGPVEVDDRWIELDYGTFEGARPGEVASSVWARWRTDPEFVPAGGESLADVFRRVAPALDELFERATHETVVVVSHVSPIKSAIAWALGMGPEVGWRTHLEQAAICRIGRSAHGPVLETFNETGHLAHVGLAPA